MSASVTLTLRAALDVPLRMHPILPARCVDLAEREIAALPVTLGRTQVPLGEVFLVQGERSSCVRVVGSTDLVWGLGAQMAGGELTVDGDAGADVGAGMTDGTIRVHGRVGDDAGVAMQGGVLHIDGDAGDRVGAAVPGAAKGMSGGEIIVGGSAGSDAGAAARRGLIVVAGNTGADTGRGMIAGSVIVLGRCGHNPGRGNKRGSIIAAGAIPVPVTYRYACTFHAPHVRLTLLYLERRHGLPISHEFVESPYRRYCGDAGNPGKGEILARVGAV